MISVAFKAPLKNKIGNLYLYNCTSESTRWLYWFRTELSPPHFTKKLHPYLQPLVTGLVKNKKFPFSEMLRIELYLWPLAKKLYHGWINTLTSSNESSWKLLPPEMQNWLRPWAAVPIYKVLVRPGQESYSRPTSTETDALNTRPRSFILRIDWLKPVLPQASLQKSLDQQKKFTRFEKISLHLIFCVKVRSFPWNHLVICFIAQKPLHHLHVC